MGEKKGWLVLQDFMSALSFCGRTDAYSNCSFEVNGSKNGLSSSDLNGKENVSVCETDASHHHVSDGWE